MSTADADTTELAAAQRAALDDSGWGEVPRLVKPHNFTFWVTVFLLFVGAVNWYADTQGALASYTTQLAQGVAYFALFGAFLLWIILRLDRFSKIPANVKILVIFLGGTVSTFAMALHYNNAFISILAKTQGSAFVNDWGPGLTAPVSEELAKVVPLILIIGLAPRVVRSAFDGLVIGMLTGAAFQIFEDVQYVWEAVDGAFGNAAAGFQIMGMRTFFGFTGHWMWTGVVGAGLCYLVGRPATKRNVPLGLLLMFIPMLSHGLWDAASTPLGVNGTPIIYAISITLTVGGIIWTYRHTAKTEQQWARDILAPEVALGTITADEVEAAVGGRRGRKRFIKSQDSPKATGHVLEGVMDLADAIAADGGTDGDEVLLARSEIARVRG